MSTAIPSVTIGLIRGSGTWGCDFPNAANFPGSTLLEDGLVFETTWGESAKFQLIRIAPEHSRDGQERLFLSVGSHGWRPGLDPIADYAYEKVAWVFQQAGVRKILVEGCVGGVSRLLDPGDLVAPDDFVDFTRHRRRAMGLDIFSRLTRMGQPVCPEGVRALTAAAREVGFPRVFPRGVMAISEGPRFESPAEIRMYRQAECDVTGQSMTPEVYFAREIGACYAAIYLVVNPAEGVRDWDHAELDSVRLGNKERMAYLVLRAVADLDTGAACGCMNYRQERPKAYSKGL